MAIIGIEDAPRQLGESRRRSMSSRPPIGLGLAQAELAADLTQFKHLKFQFKTFYQVYLCLVVGIGHGG